MKKVEESVQAIHDEFEDIRAVLDERRRIRAWCAARARAYNRRYGYGGITIVHKATGVSRSRISVGMRELEGEPHIPTDRIRRSGGGRKKHS